MPMKRTQRRTIVDEPVREHEEPRRPIVYHGHQVPPPPYKPDRVYRGLPVPYTILWPEGAERPDFKEVDEVRLRRAVRLRLCGVCGGRLFGEKEVAFVGGGTAEQFVVRWSVDPPMHVVCAEYAAIACPFLARGRKRLDEPETTLPDSGKYYIFVASGWRVYEDGVHTQPTNVLRVVPISPAAKADAHQASEGMMEGG